MYQILKSYKVLCANLAIIRFYVPSNFMQEFKLSRKCKIGSNHSLLQFYDVKSRLCLIGLLRILESRETPAQVLHDSISNPVIESPLLNSMLVETPNLRRECCTTSHRTASYCTSITCDCAKWPRFRSASREED